MAESRYAEQAAEALRLALEAVGPERYVLIEKALRFHRLAVEEAKGSLAEPDRAEAADPPEGPGTAADLRVDDADG